MRKRAWVSAFLVAAVALVLGTAAPEASAKKSCKEEVELEVAKIYWEYNSSGNDLGVHVFLDGEDWKSMKIHSPDGKTLFKVEGKQGYKELGMTELFFEGAEPNLDDYPLEDLLDLFPEGCYEFEGSTVDGAEIEGEAFLSHAIPDGPAVTTDGVSGSQLVIEWEPVTDNPDGFPDEAFTIVGYQVIVGSFQVTLPATKTKVTVPPEFLDPNTLYLFEVLSIEEGGNQTITESSFETE
jgi:hypothetical protein